MKVCHLTSVHPYNDTRIFIKECATLVAAGYETHLVAPNAPTGVENGVHLHGMGRTIRSRLRRMSETVWWVYRQALAIDAAVYHFHDPELLPLGWLLRLQGKKVIYDSHEDVPQQMLAKHYLPAPMRKLVSRLVKQVENSVTRRLDAVITVHPAVEERFRKLGCQTVNINNYPLLHELLPEASNWADKERAVCYVGGITQVRGLFEMIEAIGMTDGRLLLAGPFFVEAQRELAAAMPGWSQVEAFGRVGRHQVRDICARSVAGLVLFHPIPHHLVSMPTKIFEYMSAGLPVIASRLPMLQQVIEETKAGICVDPHNPQEIALAVQWLLDHPEEAERMGQNGRRAVMEKYSWEQESKQLLQLYSRLTAN